MPGGKRSGLLLFPVLSFFVAAEAGHGPYGRIIRRPVGEAAGTGLPVVLDFGGDGLAGSCCGFVTSFGLARLRIDRSFGLVRRLFR